MGSRGSPVLPPAPVTRTVFGEASAMAVAERERELNWSQRRGGGKKTVWISLEGLVGHPRHGSHVEHALHPRWLASVLHAAVQLDRVKSHGGPHATLPLYFTNFRLRAYVPGFVLVPLQLVHPTISPLAVGYHA